VRSATNAYFTETISVISLPEEANSLAKRVTELKDDLALSKSHPLCHGISPPKHLTFDKGLPPVF
jgi:hypothetical protein